MRSSNKRQYISGRMRELFSLSSRRAAVKAVISFALVLIISGAVFSADKSFAKYVSGSAYAHTIGNSTSFYFSSNYLTDAAEVPRYDFYNWNFGSDTVNLVLYNYNDSGTSTGAVQYDFTGTSDKAKTGQNNLSAQSGSINGGAQNSAAFTVSFTAAAEEAVRVVATAVCDGFKWTLRADFYLHNAANAPLESWITDAAGDPYAVLHIQTAPGEINEYSADYATVNSTRVVKARLTNTNTADITLDYNNNLFTNSNSVLPYKYSTQTTSPYDFYLELGSTYELRLYKTNAQANYNGDTTLVTVAAVA